MAEQKNILERKLENVPLAEILPDPNQPRKYFNEDALNELANSIRKHGVLQPIILRRDGNANSTFIVAGERRFQATKRLGLETIPAIYTDGNAAEISIVENLLRESLTPIEEAEALKRLVDDHGYQRKDLTNIIGKAEQTISEILLLNELPEEIKDESRETSVFSRRDFLKILREKKYKNARIKAFNQLKQEKQHGGKQKKTRKSKSVTETLVDGITVFHANLKKWENAELADNEIQEVKEILRKLTDDIEKILAK